MSLTLTYNGTRDIRVRIMEKRDIENARQLHNDDSTLFQLTDVNHVSEGQQQDWFGTLSRSTTSKRFVLEERCSEQFVGVFRVDCIDHVNKSVCLGLDIRREFRGNGYARHAYAYMIDYYFNQMGMNRLWLHVLDTNTIAIKLYASLGFVEEGRLRQAVFRNGKFRDYISMSLLRNEYESKIEET